MSITFLQRFLENEKLRTRHQGQIQRYVAMKQASQEFLNNKYHTFARYVAVLWGLDYGNQRSSLKFDLSRRLNPLTDSPNFAHVNTWWIHLCKISSRSLKGFVTPICVKLCWLLLFWFLCGFLQLPNYLATKPLVYWPVRISKKDFWTKNWLGTIVGSLIQNKTRSSVDADKPARHTYISQGHQT